MKIIETHLPGVILLEPKVFHDNRGYFYENFQANRYQQVGLTKPFVQDNISHSSCGVLRGLHYQLKKPQAKLVTVLRGAVLDVVVDIRRGSPTFGKWLSFDLNDQNHLQLYVPEGFAHGFAALTDKVDFLYKCTDYYQPGDEFGIHWNDPELDISWKINNPIMSDKDQLFPVLKDVPIAQLPVYQDVV